MPSSSSSYRYCHLVLCVFQLRTPLVFPSSYRLSTHVWLFQRNHVYLLQQTADSHLNSICPSYFTASQSNSWIAIFLSSLIWLISVELFECCLCFSWFDHLRTAILLLFCRPSCTCWELWWGVGCCCSEFGCAGLLCREDLVRTLLYLAMGSWVILEVVLLIWRDWCWSTGLVYQIVCHHLSSSASEGSKGLSKYWWLIALIFLTCQDRHRSDTFWEFVSVSGADRSRTEEAHLQLLFRHSRPDSLFLACFWNIHSSS